MTHPDTPRDTVYVPPENPYPTPLPDRSPTAMQLYEAHVRHSHGDYQAYPSIRHCTVCTSPTTCDQAVRCAVGHDGQTGDTTLVTVLGSLPR